MKKLVLAIVSVLVMVVVTTWGTTLSANTAGGTVELDQSRYLPNEKGKATVVANAASVIDKVVILEGAGTATKISGDSKKAIYEVVFTESSESVKDLKFIAATFKGDADHADEKEGHAKDGALVARICIEDGEVDIPLSQGFIKEKDVTKMIDLAVGKVMEVDTEALRSRLMEYWEAKAEDPDWKETWFEKAVHWTGVDKNIDKLIKDIEKQAKAELKKAKDEYFKPGAAKLIKKIEDAEPKANVTARYQYFEFLRDPADPGWGDPNTVFKPLDNFKHGVKFEFLINAGVSAIGEANIPIKVTIQLALDAGLDDRDTVIFGAKHNPTAKVEVDPLLNLGVSGSGGAGAGFTIEVSSGANFPIDLPRLDGKLKADPTTKRCE